MQLDPSVAIFLFVNPINDNEFKAELVDCISDEQNVFNHRLIHSHNGFYLDLITLRIWPRNGSIQWRAWTDNDISLYDDLNEKSKN